MVKLILHTAIAVTVALTFIACTSASKPSRNRATSATMLLLEKGRYEEVASRLSSKSWSPFSSKEERVYMYSEAINGLVGVGDSWMKQKEYEKAGLSYRKALDYYPSEAPIVRKVKLSRQEVLKKMGDCSNSLMEAGLLKYRSGRIEEAISIWEKITRFDPVNAEALKALDTATIQLENLRKLN